MKIKFFVVSACVVLTAWNASAQNILTNHIDWYSSSSSELHNNIAMSVASKITTGVGNVISLERDGVTTTFNVSGTTGTWTNISNDGLMVYNVKYQNRSGVITVQRANGAVSVTIDFTVSAPEAMKQKIVIDRFDLLP